MSRKNRQLRGQVTTLADRQIINPPPNAPPSAPSAANTGEGRFAPTDWTKYEYGPYEKFPGDRQMVMDGYLMQKYDPTVGAALSILKMLVNSHLGSYHHEDQKIQEFVQADIDSLENGLRRTVGSLLSCLWAGYAVAEKRWQTDASAWHIDALDLLHPLTFFNRSGTKCGIALDPEARKVTEVVQQPWEINEQPLPFPVANVVYWPFMQELREEVLGKRLTDRARRPWYMETKLGIFWGIYVERFAHPTPVFRVPKGQQTDATGNIKSNAEFYSAFINGLAPGKGMAIEAGPDDQFTFDLLESKAGSDKAYETVCKYWNAQTWKAVLMSPLLLEEPEHGSRAQAGTMMEMVLLLIAAIQEELGAVLVDQVAKPLITYNFGEGIDDFGEWQFDSLREEDLDLLSVVTERIIRAGAIVPTPSDERRFRNIFAQAGFVAADEITEEDQAAGQAAQQKQLKLPVGFGP